MSIGKFVMTKSQSFSGLTLKNQAGLVLLDEPLANSTTSCARASCRDPHLRGSGAIFVYATTEPEEALLLGGNTAAFGGASPGFGPTPQVYRRRRFDHRAAVQRAADELRALVKQGHQIRLSADTHAPAEGVWQHCKMAPIRRASAPTHLHLNAHSGRSVAFACAVAATEITGSETFVHAAHGPDPWVGLIHGVHAIEAGQRLNLWLDPAHLYVFDAAGRLAAPAAYAVEG